MNKKTWIAISLCLWQLSVYGQNKRWTLGASTSLDLNSHMFSDNFGALVYSGKLGYSLGFVAKYKVSDKVWARMRLLYSSKNRAESFDLNVYRMVNPFDPLIISSNEITYTNNVIELPIEAGYKIGGNGKMKLYGVIGLTNTMRINNSYSSSNTFPLSPNTRSKYYPYILGTKAGIGFLFSLGKVGMYIEPQTRFYITTVDDQSPNPVQFSLDVQVLKL
jgi:hypothetical protein